MRKGGDDQPGGVGQEADRRTVAQPGAVLEVADGQLADGVAAVVGVQVDRAAVSPAKKTPGRRARGAA